MVAQDEAVVRLEARAANEFYDRLDGPLLRAMTILVPSNPKWF